MTKRYILCFSALLLLASLTSAVRVASHASGFLQKYSDYDASDAQLIQTAIEEGKLSDIFKIGVGPNKRILDDLKKQKAQAKAERSLIEQNGDDYSDAELLQLVQTAIEEGKLSDIFKIGVAPNKRILDDLKKQKAQAKAERSFIEQNGDDYSDAELLELIQTAIEKGKLADIFDKRRKEGKSRGSSKNLIQEDGYDLDDVQELVQRDGEILRPVQMNRIDRDATPKKEQKKPYVCAEPVPKSAKMTY